jgi:hypothetical protein
MGAWRGREEVISAIGRVVDPYIAWMPSPEIRRHRFPPLRVVRHLCRAFTILTALGEPVVLSASF